MADPKMKLLRFSAVYCEPCKALEKTKVIQKFLLAHPNVTEIKYVIADKNGDSDREPYKSDWDRSEIYAVRAMPTILFEDENGAEVARVEGGVDKAGLDDLYSRALMRIQLKGGKPLAEVAAQLPENQADAEDEDEDEDEDEEDEG